MSEDHKAALAEGREQGRVVRRYLEALEANRPKRGRKRTKDSMEKRLQTVNQALITADPLKRVHLVQERKNLEAQLEAAEAQADIQELEDEFTKVAASYSERKGLTYSAWREVGVPADVLSKAGISRSSQ